MHVPVEETQTLLGAYDEHHHCSDSNIESIRQVGAIRRALLPLLLFFLDGHVAGVNVYFLVFNHGRCPCVNVRLLERIERDRSILTLLAQ